MYGMPVNNLNDMAQFAKTNNENSAWREEKKNKNIYRRNMIARKLLPLRYLHFANRISAKLTTFVEGKSLV